MNGSYNDKIKTMDTKINNSKSKFRRFVKQNI